MTARRGSLGAFVMFTSKERDSESGLDYFGARYMSSAQGRFTSPDPSNLSVDFWFPQTWNRYAYVGNNPLKFVDQNGLWWTQTHNQIIEDAFPGMSPDQLKLLQSASYATDKTTKYLGVFDPQSAEASPVHAMSNGNDPDTAHALGLAMQLTDRFIQDNEAAARVAQSEWIAAGHTGISPKALTAFGNALHTVMDSTSPAHEGFQPWSGCWAPFCLNGAWHAFRERPALYTGDVKANAIQAARQAFHDTFMLPSWQDALIWGLPSSGIPSGIPDVQSTIKFGAPPQ